MHVYSTNAHDIEIDPFEGLYITFIEHQGELDNLNIFPCE